MRLYRLFVLVAVMVAGGVFAPSASACSCIDPGPNDDQVFAYADGAFVGTFVESRDGEKADGYNPRASVLTYRVDERHKGGLGETVEVWTSSSNCGLSASPGQRDALYLKRSPDGSWSSSFCSKTTPERMRAAAAGPQQPPPPPAPPQQDALAPQPVFKSIGSRCAAKNAKKARKAKKRRAANRRRIRAVKRQS